MSISFSASAILAMHTGTSLTSDEKLHLKNTLFISSCYLKLQAEHGTLNASEIEFLQSLLEEKPKKEIRKIKPSPCVGPTPTPTSQTSADIMAPLDLDSILGSNSASLSAAPPSPTIPVAVTIDKPVEIPSRKNESVTTPTIPASSSSRKYRLDVPNETKCRARRYGAHIPNTKPKVYFENQCNNKPEGEYNLCKTCQKYFNNKDDKDSHKRREWNGFVCGDIPDHTAIVGGKWFQKKFPKGLPEETSITSSSTISTVLDSTPVATSEMPQVVDPIEESLAEESEPVKTEEWRPYTLNGVLYAIHFKNNKVYKMGQKDGKEAVLMDQYCGVFQNGIINQYVDEEEVDD